MSRRAGRKRVVTFQADAEILELLSSLPNASAFVRRAVVAAMHRQCPLCRGAGWVPGWVGRHYAEVLLHHPPPEGGDGRRLEQSATDGVIPGIIAPDTPDSQRIPS